MKRYKVKIAPAALEDIQNIIDWYNDQQNNLGIKFRDSTLKHINSLTRNPHIYAIRYNQIRCVLIKKFPYMVHFYINEDTKEVEILAVISTHRDPKIWEEKTSR